MQPKTLFWLSFVVAALGAFIYFYERDLPSADAEAVHGLVDLLTDLRKRRTLEDFDPAELGLAEPRARLTVETADGAAVENLRRSLEAVLEPVAVSLAP
ncbi:MAG: hypothetical protein SX243_12650 [Acidobacteriota bacterium]|nr:hypothetical protein [Acidobacteriota bacterium]